MKQRVGLVVVVVLGGWLYRHGVDAMRVADGAEGASLLAADSPLSALGQLLSVTLAVMVVASIVSAMGNPLAGLFAATTALVVPAITGGSIDEWLRSAPSSGAYWTLALEAGLWALIVAGMTWVIHTTAGRVNERLPESWQDPEAFDRAGTLAREYHGGGDPVVKTLTRSVGLSRPLTQAILAGAAATLIGLIPTAILLQTTAVNQSAWGIAVSFVIAGVLAHQLFPSPNPTGVLISPLLAAMFWYVYAAVTQDGSAVMLSNFYTDHFVNGATALPIFYASAGVAGAAMGIGWSQALIHSHLVERAEADDAAPA